MMKLYALVAVGGAIGSVGRFWMAMAVGRLTGPAFPWGTLLINILGSGLIGWLAGLSLASRMPYDGSMRAFTMVGLCGGFTTFSAFSLQTVELLREGQPLAAAANACASVLLCLLATMAGLWLARP